LFAELVETVEFFVSRMKMMVDPTGCLGAAAVFGGQLDLRGKRSGLPYRTAMSISCALQACSRGSPDPRHGRDL
jgi:hypothetical protein